MAKISVIISTYNRPHYLAKVLDGFLNQTLKPYEIVIADDGSKEDTRLLIESYKDKSDIPIIHVWHEDNGFRLAEIRNKAIAVSNGDYIIICDDDSIPDIHFVEDHNKYKMKGCFIQGHRVLLGKEISSFITYRECNFKKLLKYTFKGNVKNISNAIRLPIPLIKISKNLKGIRGCNMSFYKADLLSVNGYNENIVGWGREDSELAARLYNIGIVRKDIKFCLPVYHLYHDEYSRDKLNRNDEILNETIKKGITYCFNGINKHLRF
jgi:glycosyltransferase involved in cell wall biosynthesis